MISRIQDIPRPAMYIRHVYFLDLSSIFRSLGKPPPIMINIIREPVELFISNYYYRRFGFKVRLFHS
jgi:dermatan/chondrotin sulfate uronyl 2-O-sulfotransferase UST